jgi:hypothetical protein
MPSLMSIMCRVTGKEWGVSDWGDFLIFFIYRFFKKKILKNWPGLVN